MKRLLLMLTGLFALAIAAHSQSVVLEDFEGGAKLQWNNNAGDSILTVVDKPAGGDTLNINPSTKVGSYTKVAGKGYSLLIATLPQPLNLSTNNQFRIQVKSPVRTSFILKLEGAGEAIEETKKIGVANQWIEYTFNFSAAKNMTTLNKVILFFDPGVDASSDTYLFDNLIQEGGACAGVAKNPDMIDDFECQRNGVYGDPGYLDIAAVDNPDKSGINTSNRVGRYTDRNGSFHAMVIPFANPIALTAERNQVRIKVWAPKAGRLLVKFEGGGSPAKEKDAQITETNKWVEYNIDFSDQAGANHRTLVFFFNAGVEMAAGDIYYIDDIQITSKAVPGPLEDFEPNPKLTWEPFNATAGTFNGAINNPDKTGVNTTDRVGSYTKGSSKLGGLSAFINGINLTDFPQIDLQVWAPAGAKNFTLQLSSATQGIKEVTRPIAETQKWVQLSFNFDQFKTITDFESVRLIFDKDLESTATWYFDNLRQATPTVDPCEGTVRNINFVDDFDCQRNSTLNNNALRIINNPDARGINPNPLDKVGEYTDPINEPFAALVFRRDSAYNLANTNQLHVKIWSPKAVPIGFKLEGGTSPAVEIVRNVTRTNEWVEYVVDFSGQAAANHRAVVIFFNFGVNNPEADKYYIDDVEWRRAPYKGCVVTFESPEFTLTNWAYFANGATPPAFAVVANPNKSGVNTSNNVGIFVEQGTGTGVENFAGMFADLPAPIELGASRTVKMKVLGPVANSFVLKMEGAIAPALNSGDIRASYTTPGQWQELTWDFSKTQGGQNIAVGSQYGRITMIPDIDNTPPTARNYHFDDITVGEGSCTTTSIFDPVVVEALKVMPNPVYNELTVQNADKIDLFVIYNAMGQRLSVVQPNGISNLAIPVEHLTKGVYILAGYDASGMLIANARFVKQ
ncbi:MAG: T9SS type A sorting domain-containing protein [Saprospiraceae bacterium]